jgi:hypothetical protein
MSGTFSYAQARLQARHAARPGSALWIRLEASRSFAHYLETARGTTLEPWLAGLQHGSTVHEIEPALRRAFAEYARRVASWLPERWQSSVAWTAELAELPTQPAQQVALAQWRRRFRELAPRPMPEQRRGLDELAEHVERHRARLLEVEGARTDADGWQLDLELERALVRLFRRHTEQPAAALCHLTLTALDLARVRAGLSARALFEREGRAG